MLLVLDTGNRDFAAADFAQKFGKMAIGVTGGYGFRVNAQKIHLDNSDASGSKLIALKAVRRSVPVAN